MHCHHHSATVLVAIVAGVIASTYAQAAVRVGGAVSVVREVSGSLSGRSWNKKVQGDDVYENEFIQTAEESNATLLFVDETDIKIGPAATLRIDRVVFNPNRSVSKLIVTAGRGPMRWNSGVSLSDAYQVKTPTAIIKVHGTTFDLFAEPQQTTVVLRRGTIEVCLIDSPQRCQTLSRSGDTVLATSNDLERPQRAGLGPSEFAERCLSAEVMTPCAIMASVNPTKSGAVTPRTHRVTDDAPTTPRVVDRGPLRGEPNAPTTPRVVDPGPTHPSGELAGLPVNLAPMRRNCYPHRGRLICRPSMPPPSNYRPVPGNYRPVPAGNYRTVPAGNYRTMRASTAVPMVKAGTGIAPPPPLH
jgi:hypothetical protein